MRSQHQSDTLGEAIFDNRFTRELPADPETANYRRQVTGACYSRVHPAKVAKPQLIAYSREMAEQLGFSADFCATDDFAQVFAGNRLLPGMEPYAMCYGGHQFGNWAGQLGDGRAINLGEILTSDHQRLALQLKGAGPTPYSRMADGLAVLRSSLREFLCSEAMHHLGVPTTRALSLVSTGEKVERDMLYDGNAQLEPGAIVCRVAPSFIRFGNFEIFASRGDIPLLRQMVDYTIRNDFPHHGQPSPGVYLKWFDDVCQRTAEMIVHWMRVGFVHGVMNTDNMSILGLTIDYGPYGWLEDYDPNWTPNTTDASGRRYRFGHQAHVAHWNLYQLANAIYPLIEDVEPLQDILADFSQTYTRSWQAMMAQKLGLKQFQADSDVPLLQELLSILESVETDMTIFFRKLAQVAVTTADADDASNETLMAPLRDAYYQPAQLDAHYQARLVDWLRAYQARVKQDGSSDAQRRARMDRVNPKYVLRNYLAQQAIDKAEQGDCAMVQDLLELLRHPYDEQTDKEHYAARRPEWARHRVGCSMLSCSS